MNKSQRQARRIKKQKRRILRQKPKQRKNTMKQQTKWYKKPAIIKTIIAVIALILGAFGLNMTEQSQEMLLNAVVDVQEVVDQVDASNNQ
ncbi:MAG: hypothetical protein GY793_04700 [Proteobacteria bacterium]|nr:hypothetical protein [Pseudomonadota bacterium]